MNLENQKSFYDEYWKSTKFINSLQLRRCVKILEYFTDVKRAINQPKILDLGAGDGRFTAFIGQFGKTDAVELSQLAVDKANKLYPHVNFEQGNALSHDFKDKKYDVIISQEVIEHIEEKHKYLKTCYDVLKKDGYMILTTPNKNVLDHMLEGKTWSNQPIELPMSKKHLIKLLKSYNFKIIHYDSIIMNFGNMGYFKIVNHKYIIGGCKVLGLGKAREQLLSKLGYGLHHCVFAKKIS